MKRIIIITATLFALLISSCQFNQSVSIDSTTGAFYKGDGLGCDGITMEINGKTDNRNNFIYGEKVNFIFNNVRGFKKEKNKSFPGLSIYIVKNDKDTILSNSNLLDNLKEGTELSPLQLNANFVCDLPSKNNEKYKILINIRDEKGDGTFSYEMPFTVKESNLLNIESQNIEYSKIYLWNESLKQPVLSNKTNKEDVLVLILEGLKGLEVKNGNVYPLFSIDLEDSRGSKIISNQNILSDFEFKGVNAEDFTRGQLPVILKFNDGQVYNPCKLTAQLTDKNSTKKLKITAELNIE